jgi:hypothetical protein
MNRKLLFTRTWKYCPSVSRSVSVLLLWLVIAVTLIACAPQTGTPFSATPTVFQALAASTTSATGALEIEQIVKRLTGSKWQEIRSQDPNLAPEIVTWEFYANGMFRWRFNSDFSESHMGAWEFAPTSEGSGILFLASTIDDPSRFDVLSLTFQDGELQLGEFTYQAAPLIDTDTPPAIQEADRLAVTHQRNQNFALWMTLTATDWRSTSEPPPGDANLYEFRQDGMYTAHFELTQCQFSGTWSTSISGGNNGVVRLSVPENACDPRGPQPSFVREIPVRLDGEALILYETVYAPLPKGR